MLLTTLAGTARASTGGENADEAEARPRVLLLGDSNMYGVFGAELEKALDELGFEVLRRAKPGSGLARPDYFNWIAEGQRLVTTFAPHAVIIIVGGNDGQRLLPPGGGDWRDAIMWDDEERWSAEYQRRVRGLVGHFVGANRLVYLLSPTNRRPPIARRKMLRVRELQRRALSGLPGTRWIDTFELSSDRWGRYLAFGRDKFGRRVEFRRGDGIHLTREGAASLTERLLLSLMARGLAKAFAEQGEMYGWHVDSDVAGTWPAGVPRLP